MRRIFFLISALVSLLGAAFTQEPPTPQEPTTPPAAQEQGQRPGFQPPATEPRPYDRVITKDAKTKHGIFTVHQVKEHWYYEIPKSELGKDFLWVTQLARAPLGANRSSFVDRVVRWERFNNRVLLREIKYDIVAAPNEPIAKAVAKANSDTVLMSFNVESVGKDEAPVIEVTRLLTTDIGEVGAKPFLRVGNVDAARTFINRINVYPLNVEADSTFTYAPMPAGGGGAGGPGPLGFGAGPRQNSTTAMVHYSMIKLPEKPMMGRLFDDRVGFFNSQFTDYGSP